MSKVVICTMLSVDGYTEGPGGDVMAMPMDLAFAEHNADRLRTAGSVLFGGTTFRGMAQFWPGQDKNMEAPEDHRYIGQRYADGLPITVISDTVTEEDAGVFLDQTTIVRRADAHEHVAGLRGQDGGDVLTYGSRTLWADLLAHGLVDELHLMIGPAVVAGDAHAFAGVPAQGLRLLGVRQWDGSDNVVLSYATR